MPNALRKADERLPTPLAGDPIRTAGLRPVAGGDREADASFDTGVMVDPPHPMHRALLARMSAPAVVEDGLSRPARMAIIFYCAIASWILAWLLFVWAAAWF